MAYQHNSKLGDTWPETKRMGGPLIIRTIIQRYLPSPFSLLSTWDKTTLVLTLLMVGLFVLYCRGQLTTRPAAITPIP